MTTTPDCSCLIDPDEQDADTIDALEQDDAPAPLTALELGAEIVVSGPSMAVDPRTTDEWQAFASDAAEVCIARFAAAEADVTSAALTGLGRTSGVRFPRLGGVLHGRIE